MFRNISAFKNKDIKVLIENFAWLSILQIASYFFPFITLPYLSRVIGVEKFGEIAFANAIMAYLTVIVDWGFLFSAVRDIAKVRDDKEEVSNIYSTVMWSRLILLLTSFVILVFVTLFIDKLNEIKYVLMFSFTTLIGHFLFVDWMFQALEKMKYITILNLFTRIFFTFSIFIFIKTKEDYLYHPLLIGLGGIVAGLFSLFIIGKWGIYIKKPIWKDIRNAINYNFDLFINQFVPNLYNNLSSVLLGFYHGSVANGLLEAGNKFNEISSQFLRIVSRTFFPYLSRKIDSHLIYMKIHLGLSVIISITLFLGAPFLVDLFYTEEFKDSILVLRILSISLIFLSLSNIYGTNYLIVIGQESILRKITVCCSVLGFILAIPMVYYFSYIGGALVIVITRALLALVIMKKAIKIKLKEK